MSDKISVDEAKRRRAAREAAKRQTPARNGNGAVKHLPRTGWNDLGPIGLHDKLVRGIMGERQLAMIYGESGSGKSFLAFDLAAHIALGWPWLGHVVTMGAVLYVAAEGAGGWANRVAAFCQHHQLDEDQRARLPFQFILVPVNLGREGSADVAGVIQAADELAEEREEPVRVIVIDTMARATPGSNENDPLDVGSFVGKCDAIRDKTGATPLIVHHTGKNLSAGARGHSALRAAVDCELEVERVNGSRLLRVRKSRDGQDGAEIGFSLLSVEIGHEGDEAITSCVVQSASVEEHAKAKATASKDKAKWQLAEPLIDNTLIDFPEPAPSKFPSWQTFSPWARLRQALEHASIIDGVKPNTRDKQWQRIRDKLMAKEIIKIEGPLFYRPGRRDA